MRLSWMRWAVATLVALLTLSSLPLAETRAQDATPVSLDKPLDPRQIRETLTRVADWSLDHPADYPPGNWVVAPLYDGLIDACLVLDKPEYLAAVIKEGRRIRFAPGENLGNADSHGAGNSWLRIYLMDPTRDPALLDRFQSRFRQILAGRQIGLGWSWADALYMAPPTLVRMGLATGDQRYFDLAFSEFLATTAVLYDREDHLFYRDARFFDQRAPNGEHVYWSRGNGWVYAALAEVLDVLPPDNPSRGYYLDLFKEMSGALLDAQQKDGLWYPSLLDPEQVPIGETSGSALFLFGMAWGVGQGVLDRATYEPAITRGWNALLTKIRPDGEVNYVQPVAAEPKDFDPRTSEPYGAGAVLGAGAEILRMLDAEADVDPAKLRAEAEPLVDAAPNLTSEKPS